MTWSDVLGRVHAESWGPLLGQLIRSSGRPDLAEDALAEAFAQAAEQWPAALPDNPAGWLATVAGRRLIDARRQESRRAAPEFRAAVLASAEPPGPQPPPGTDADERLPLLFMAAHPALAEDVRPALALRFVLGVPTDTIARLFLVPVPTMAARLTRAKRRLANVRVAFDVPDLVRWPDRVDDVARAVYLGFTAGYAPGGDEVVRVSAAGDAVRLAVLAAQLLPGQAALQALAALLELHHARRAARTREDGALVLLADQDRKLWDTAAIESGLRRLTGLQPTAGYAEELRLQALIAGFHAATAASDTDWVGIARAYRRLEQLNGSPIVRLNRAVAVGEAYGPQAGLALLRAAGERLPGHHRVALVRAELLARDGRVREAAEAFTDALSLMPEGAERRHVAGRLQALRGGH